MKRIGKPLTEIELSQKRLVDAINQKYQADILHAISELSLGDQAEAIRKLHQRQRLREQLVTAMVQVYEWDLKITPE